MGEVLLPGSVLASSAPGDGDPVIPAKSGSLSTVSKNVTSSAEVRTARMPIPPAPHASMTARRVSCHPPRSTAAPGAVTVPRALMAPGTPAWRAMRPAAPRALAGPLSVRRGQGRCQGSPCWPGPVTPATPAGRATPAGPGRPVIPGTPVIPCRPVTRGTPVIPCRPVSPGGPAGRASAAGPIQRAAERIVQRSSPAPAGSPRSLDRSEKYSQSPGRKDSMGRGPGNLSSGSGQLAAWPESCRAALSCSASRRS